MNEQEQDEVRKLRQLAIRADSWLSLLWHRHVPDKTVFDTAEQYELQATIDGLRTAYERGVLSGRE